MLGSQTKSEILIAGKDKNAGHMNHCPNNSRLVFIMISHYVDHTNNVMTDQF